MTDADLIIIGAGPAGLSAAQYGARSMLSVLVLEQMASGGQALTIDMLENYPGVFPAKNGYVFIDDMHKQAANFGAVFLSEAALKITKEKDIFHVSLGNGEVKRSYAIIFATGAKYRTLDIPGEREYYGRGVSYCATCDGPFFKNKKIFVVGGGDAACDEAQFLSRLADEVIMIHRREKFRAQKALAERVLANPNIEVRFNTVMKEIKGSSGMGGRVSSVVIADSSGNQEREENTDGVFIFTGSNPQTSLLGGTSDDNNGISAKLDENGYIITDEKMNTSVSGLFAAGDARATPFRQIVTAAADGAIAARYASIYIDELKGEAY